MFYAFYLIFNVSNPRFRQTERIRILLRVGTLPDGWFITFLSSSLQMFPGYCRELGSGLSTCFGFTMFYVVIQISPYLLTEVGTSLTFYMFGAISGVGSVFLYLCLPETKNKTMNDATWTRARPTTTGRQPVRPRVKRHGTPVPDLGLWGPY